MTRIDTGTDELFCEIDRRAARAHAQHLDLGRRVIRRLSPIFLWRIAAIIYYFRHFLQRHRQVRARAA